MYTTCLRNVLLSMKGLGENKGGRDYNRHFDYLLIYLRAEFTTKKGVFEPSLNLPSVKYYWWGRNFGYIRVVFLFLYICKK